jgi:tRNA(Arg) A34 adenosine deaminase TadA
MQTQFSLSLPTWLIAELGTLPQALDTLEERMALVNRLADRNFREGNGGPFAAIVVEAKTGRLVSVGVNVVLASGVSAAHAEVPTAGGLLREAERHHLGGDPEVPLQLVVNWRPCVMCYGATMWSGIRELVVAGSGDELEKLTGFDEGPMRDDWAEQFEARGISVTQDVSREEALRVFRAYGDADTIVYNARGGMTVA